MSLRVATFNVNGIRAARRRGFDGWLAGRECDVVALQEVRCPDAALPEGAFGDYHLAYDSGRLPGRNGVAILTRHAPVEVRAWDDHVLVREPGENHLERIPSLGRTTVRRLRPFLEHGRYLEVDLADVPVTIASAYVPKGGLPAELQKPGRLREAPDGGARYRRKMAFLAGFARHLTTARREAAARGRHYLVMGDFNIAHTPLDLHHWRRNQRSEGFLPAERAWLDEVIGPRRLVDVVRRLHPDEVGPYSWWSWLAGSFDSDSGWRIDYHLASPALAMTALRGGTDRDPGGDERISDHAPVVVDYDL